jgi:transcriptional regulator with XRE-family HTH domain
MEMRKFMNSQNEWLINFGVRLKCEREKQGLTQQGLAIKAKTKQDYIAQIERGSRNPTLKTLINILYALDVSADHLIYRTDINDKDEKGVVIAEIISFLSRRKLSDIDIYYEIIKFASNYIGKY